jgi:4-hydroxybenzoate polyprenyltransferase
MNASSQAPAAPRGKLALYLNLIRWDRPAGWLLLLWPTLAALWMASGGFPGWHLLVVFTLGTVLMRSAGCCINDVADREFDRHVKRTAGRPVTSGAVSVREALGVGALLALVAFGLVLTTNALTVQYSFAALAVTLAYPYAKRWVSMPQAVLGVAFSFGIPMAFAAVRSEVPAPAWWLLVGNLFWVLAYDTEYAMVDRDDDLRIGIQTSAITLGRFDVAAVMLFYGVFLALWGWLGWRFGLGEVFGAGLLLAAAQVLWHHRLIRDRSREGCFQAFKQNHWLGASVFAGQLHRALVGQRQHGFRLRQHAFGAGQRGRLADQPVLVVQPGAFQLAVGVANRRRRGKALEFDQLAIEQCHRLRQSLVGLRRQRLQRQRQIGLGRALRQHALAAGLVDGVVQVLDLRPGRRAGERGQAQGGELTARQRWHGRLSWWASGSGWDSRASAPSCTGG